MDAAVMSVSTVTSPALSAIPGIKHAFFTRQGGVSTGIYGSLNGGLGSNDDPKAVKENRRRMAATLGVAPGLLAVPWQVHSAEAVITDAPWDRMESPHVDGVATATHGLAVAVTIADCCPVLFADPVARVVAAAHSGWKGAIGGVLEATIARMEELGSNREDIVAALGPCIRQQSYEVGPDFAGRFTAEDPGNARFFEPSTRPGHAMFELGGYVVERLKKAGLGHVDDLGIDTYSDEERFFSFRRATHRAEPDYGRMIAGIALV
jgi:YfiH family protein